MTETETTQLSETENPEDVFLDKEMLTILTGPKAKALEILAGMKAKYNVLKTKADEIKRRHDLLVDSARGLRKDFRDVERIEQRGRKSEASEEAKATGESPSAEPQPSETQQVQVPDTKG